MNIYNTPHTHLQFMGLDGAPLVSYNNLQNKNSISSAM